METSSMLCLSSAIVCSLFLVCLCDSDSDSDSDNACSGENLSEAIGNNYMSISGMTSYICTWPYEKFANRHENQHLIGKRERRSLNEDGARTLGYSMRERLVFTYSLTNSDLFGVIRIQFSEYDLHPNSRLYIYDGTNVSAPGTVWTHTSPSPVYTTSGPHVFLVFKTGEVDLRNTHLGFRGRVDSVAANEWTDKPSTGLCTPFVKATYKGQRAYHASIRYRESTVALPVRCTYVARFPGQTELAVIMNSGSMNYMSEIVVRDFPSGDIGTMLAPFSSSHVQFAENDALSIFLFNVSSAVYGYHLLLTPYFTASDRWVFIISTKQTLSATDAMLWAARQYTQQPERRTCPYKACRRNNNGPPKCVDYQMPCWSDEDGEQLDCTCDFYSPYANSEYSRCASDNHCYNTRYDTCDGFSDCANHTDETEALLAFAPDQVYEIVVCVVSALVVVAVLVSVICYVCPNTRRSVKLRLLALWAHCRGNYGPPSGQIDLEEVYG